MNNYVKSSKKDDLYIGFEAYPEQFVTLNWNGILVPRYQISNYGRIFDTRDNRQLGYSIDSDGYFMASIHIQEFGYKKIRVHRFVLMSFDFNPNFKDFHVNHRDGNKLNPILSNLEWMLPIENTRHGWDNGLNKNIGTKNGNGIYEDATINIICQLIDDGFTNSQISDQFGVVGRDNRMKFSATISGIRNFETHQYISCNYNFAQGIVIGKRYDLDITHKICQLLSDPDIVYSYNDIMTILNIPSNEYINFKNYINNLLWRRTAKSVTSQYDNLKKPIE